MEGKEAPTADDLTPEEIEVIRKTWSQVKDSEEMAIDFYNRLFYMHPFLRPLFKENIQFQARKFTEQIGGVINHIGELKSLQNQLREHSKHHRNQQVKPQHYNYFQEALLYALKHHLIKDWTESAEKTWIKFYRILAEQMMGGNCQQKLSY